VGSMSCSFHPQLFLPIESSFFDDEKESNQKQCDENDHLHKSLHTQVLKVHGPGVHENDLYIEQDEEDSDHKIFDVKGHARITLRFNAAFKRFQLCLRLSFGPQQVGKDHGGPDESKRHEEHQGDGDVVG
jgi:hypothetical protein